jgi:hypothetical protein
VDTIRSIYQEYFQGRSVYKMAFARFREKREEIYALYNNVSSLIDSHYRNRTLGHLDRFYEAIGTRDNGNDTEAEGAVTRPDDSSSEIDPALGGGR